MFQLKKWFHPESCIILIFWVTLDQHPFSFEANQGPSRKKQRSLIERDTSSPTVCCWIAARVNSSTVKINYYGLNVKHRCSLKLDSWKKQQALTVVVYCFAASMNYDVFLSCFWKTIMMAALSQTAHDVVYPKLVGKPSNDLMIHRKKKLDHYCLYINSLMKPIWMSLFTLSTNNYFGSSQTCSPVTAPHSDTLCSVHMICQFQNVDTHHCHVLPRCFHRLQLTWMNCYNRSSDKQLCFFATLTWTFVESKSKKLATN